ncbi:MAG: chemotaxis protein [Thiobacillus sp. 65-69]|nr:PAS domain-containing protein [Thiobacillus sp.]OJW34447.1 MAG: chemotaxis protein [Thiobacillus sp. 65-69]
MRTNLPVTSNEYVLLENEAPTSRTDIHGNIVYVNHDFIRISGFSEAELIGAPQNIVRHPDMPSEAFADMWGCLKSGKPWTGLVKNRCKNGDFYWVEASAAPIIDGDTIVGYTSVRSKPTREQIQHADAAYRAIRSGDRGLRIEAGQAVRQGWQDGFQWLMAMRSLKMLLIASSAAVAAMFLTMGVLSWFAEQGVAGLAHIVMVMAVLGVPLAGLCGWLAYRNVVQPLVCIRREIQRLSASDLTSRIHSSGVKELASILDSLRILQVNMRWAIGQIKESTDIVNAGAIEIATGNADLSARTESQASSLEETASSMEEITSTVKQNADNARQANQLVVSTAEIAAKGGTVVNEVVETMASIKDSSQKITNIIGVIDGIAFQTNILALNAAVEAARAGEQGRGFAVVASEVRSLAQRSAGAAKEIKTLIEDSVGKVDAGGRLVDEAGHTMDEIVTSVKRVTDIMSEIAAANGEQSSGIEQVNQAVMQMDEITQQNAALVEEAAAAESLQTQAGKLAELVATFKLEKQAGRSRSPSAGGQRPSKGSGTAIAGRRLAA